MSTKNTIAWIIRILVSAVFLLSAVSKLASVWQFEKQIVDLQIADWAAACYWARFIIGAEIAVAIAILQPHFLRKLVVPLTILLLIAFCVHLGITMVQYGNKGNCGCFGQLIKMTPTEALIKNILTIGALIYLWFLLRNKHASTNTALSETVVDDLGNAKTFKHKFIYPLFILVSSLLFVFVFFPCKKQCPTPTVIDVINNNDSLTKNNQKTNTIDTLKTKTIEKKDTLKKPEPQPKQAVSAYSKLNNFRGTVINIDKGKRILCFFAPGCDHCQNTCKSLVKLRKQNLIPEVCIYFMDEEPEKIPDFFKIAGGNFPYQVVDIISFWKVIGKNPQGQTRGTPGVAYLWNGNIMKFFDGTDANEYKENILVSEVKKGFK